MTAVLTMPERIYLVTCDPPLGPLDGWTRRGYLVRAAALAELQLAGLVADRGGRVVPVGAPGRARNVHPVLAGVLAQVVGSRPRRWKHWVRRDARGTSRAVRDGLEAAGAIRVERRRVLGVIPRDRVTVRDHPGVKELTAGLTRAVTGSAPVDRLPADQVALAAIAVAGRLDAVCTGRQRRQHRQRIGRLIDHAGPAAVALRAVLSEDAAAVA